MQHHNGASNIQRHMPPLHLINLSLLYVHFSYKPPVRNAFGIIISFAAVYILCLLPETFAVTAVIRNSEFDSLAHFC